MTLWGIVVYPEESSARLLSFQPLEDAGEFLLTKAKTNSDDPDLRRSSGSNLLPSPRRSYGHGVASGGSGGTGSGAGPSRSSNKSGLGCGGGAGHHHAHPDGQRPISRWAAIRTYLRTETRTFFGLVENGEDLKVCH